MLLPRRAPEVTSRISAPVLTAMTQTLTRTARQSQRPSSVRRPAGRETFLDAGLLPVEELASLGDREGWRPRPIYQAHRWFARRFASAFRALLVAAELPADADFWNAYHAGVDYRGKVVLDPFVGGGTSVVEALRLGADVIGADVDAVACAITRFEVRAARTPELAPSLERLCREVGRRMARYYRTEIPGVGDCEVLHYFHVQLVPCRGCSRRIEAHPHFQLAYEAEGQKQWAFCRDCHAVQELPKSASELRCQQCAFVGQIAEGPVRDGLLECPYCGAAERLIDVAERTGKPPKWHLFALETLEPADTNRPVPMSRRHFYPASDKDRRLLAAAGRALRSRARRDGSPRWVPERRIPAERRSDDRLSSARIRAVDPASTFWRIDRIDPVYVGRRHLVGVMHDQIADLDGRISLAKCCHKLLQFLGGHAQPSSSFIASAGSLTPGLPARTAMPVP